MKTSDVVNKINNYSFLILISIIFFTINLSVLLIYPAIAGDTKIIKIVAENIFNNRCISLSSPITKDCIPHWGSNQGPGYPILLALSWTISNKNLIFIKIFQILIHYFSILYLIGQIKINYQIKRFSFYYIIFFLSPLTFGWHRFILTESLVFSLSILLIAILIPLFCKKNINIILLSFVISIGFFIRYDFILWLVPIIFTYIYVFNLKKTIYDLFKLGIISLIIVSPYLIRNYVSNLNFIPPTQIGLQLKNDLNLNREIYYPENYVDWIKSWATTNYMYTNALYPIDKGNYDLIYVDPRAYYSEIEKNDVEENLSLLHRYENKEFPKSIDENFKIILEEKKKNFPFKIFVVNPLKKMFSLWFNPVTSLGFPNTLNNYNLSLDKILQSSLNNQLKILKDHFLSFFGKIINFTYRALLILAFIYISFHILNRHHESLRPLYLFTTSFFLFKTIFLSQTIFIETRHIITPAIMIEIFIIIFILQKKSFQSKAF